MSDLDAFMRFSLFITYGYFLIEGFNTLRTKKWVRNYQKRSLFALPTGRKKPNYKIEGKKATIAGSFLTVGCILGLGTLIILGSLNNPIAIILHFLIILTMSTSIGILRQRVD